MLSIKEKMAELESKLASAQADVESFKAANETCVADAEAFRAENEVMKEAFDAFKASAEATEQALAEELEAAKAEASAKAEEVAELKAKLELVPVADASGGVDPVADSSVSQDAEIDHLAIVNSLEGAARIAYYRKHAEKIDAAYKS